jgi:hypothetical protein
MRWTGLGNWCCFNRRHPHYNEAREPNEKRAMTTVEVSSPEVLERWKSEATANCAPLYIQDAYLVGGYDASTRNATATFVKIGGAILCLHLPARRRRSEQATRHGHVTLPDVGARVEDGFYQSFLDRH